MRHDRDDVVWAVLLTLGVLAVVYCLVRTPETDQRIVNVLHDFARETNKMIGRVLS